MPHDFKRFPELRNNQMQFYYWESPHRQITRDITVRVVKVTDGDTIRVQWEERDFDFPVRIVGINAPELNEEGGHESRDWLKSQILNEEVEVTIDPEKRVEKWGRLLGGLILRGMDIGKLSMAQGFSVPFETRKIGKFPDMNKILNIDLQLKWP